MFLTYYALFCVIIIVAGLFGVVSSGLYSFVSKRKNTVPASVGCSVLVGIGVFILAISSVCGYWNYRANDFYGYGGDFDYYRIPLDYPYEITMIDTTDCGAINKWKEDGSSIVFGVTEYYKQGNIIVGRISPSCFPFDNSGWFVFDTSTGEAIKYQNEQEYIQALKKIGFSEEPNLLTLDENADLYWDSYAEGRK